MLVDPFVRRWLLWLVGLGIGAAGVIFGLDAISLLPPEPYSGFVGIGLGCLCLFGAMRAATP